MPPTEMWLFIFLLFQGILLSLVSGESTNCQIRFDEISTLKPESNVYGAPTDQHNYYVALRFENCKHDDHPSLSAYSVAIVRLTDAGTAPMRIAFVDLFKAVPILKNNGLFSRRTQFSEVHKRYLIGNFHSGIGKESGVLIDWAAEGAVVKPWIDSADDKFLTLFLLIHSDKKNKHDTETIKRLLSVQIRDSSHRMTSNDLMLSTEFDDNWSFIASKTVQVIGVMLYHSQIQVSPILAGLNRRISDFVILTIPNLGGVVLQDIPKEKAIRVCSSRWVLTKQTIDATLGVHCDQIDGLVDLHVAPRLFDWTSDSSSRSSQIGTDTEGRGCSRGPLPPKRRRLDIGEVIVIHGGKAYTTTVPLNDCHYLMINHEHQITVSRQLFGSSKESGRLRKLSSRNLYTAPRYFERMMESGFISLSRTMDECLRVFDIYSYLISGSVIYADDIRDYILKKIKKDISTATERWSETIEHGKGKDIRCYNLYIDLSMFIPFHIAISYTNTDGRNQQEIIMSELGDRLTAPTIYIDADGIQLYEHGNGFTDSELSRIPLFDEDADNVPKIECPERDETMESEEGYCGEGEEESELLRLTRETHEMVVKMSEGVTSASEKLFIKRKLQEYRDEHAYLQHKSVEMIKKIAESELIPEETVEHIFSDNRLVYINVTYDEENRKIYFWCYACKENKLTNAKHIRRVDWEITDSSNTKSLLDNLRHHHQTHHHSDSVRVLESNAEKKFLAEFTSENMPPNPKITPTEVMVKAAYYAAKLAIPGYRFKDICNLLRDAGVAIGHTNTCRTSYMRVIELIANMMRQRQIDHLINNKIPFAIMVDTMTDPQGRPVLSILLSAIIEGHPREIFYASIHISDETGASIYHAVIDRFERDGMLEHLDNYLIGISSDGAANMIEQRGFGGRLRARLEEHRKKNPQNGIPVKIVHFHCAGHLIELGLQDAFKSLARENERDAIGSEAISAVINYFASFYSSVAASRRESLHRTVQEQQLSGSLDPFLNPSRDFDIRWTPSALAARKTLVRMYKATFDNLLEYDNEVTRKIDSKNKAERNLAIRARTLLMILKDLAFYENLTFEVGILDCIQFLSLEGQRSASNLIDFLRAYNEMAKCIREFCKNPFSPYIPSIRDSKEKKWKVGDVPFMRNVFVETVSSGSVPIKDSVDGKRAIFGDDSPSLQDLRFRLDFTTSPGATASGSKDTYFNPLSTLRMTDDEGEQEKQTEKNLDPTKADHLYKKVDAAGFVRLDEKTRVHYGDAIISKLKLRLHDSTLEWAESFTVENLLFDRHFNTPYGVKNKRNRKNLCDLFNLNSDQVERDIATLRKGFVTQVSSEMRKELEKAKTDIVLFHTALSGKDCYGSELESIISLIITLPINSAGVERMFSVFNHYMSKKRTSLNIAHLEAYVSLHQNGPEPHDFVPGPYVNEWLKMRKETEFLQPDEDEEDDMNDDDEEESFSFWNDAFSTRRNIPRITIYD